MSPLRRIRSWLRVDLVAALGRLRELLAQLRNKADRSGRCHPALTGLEVRMLFARPVPLPVIYAGDGGGSVVKGYDAETGDLNFSFQAYGQAFAGGVRVAAADFTLDGYPDVLVGPGPGGGPNVRVIDGVSGKPVAGVLGSFWAFDPSFAGGVHVAAADVDGDHVPDAIASAGVGGGPRVRILSGVDGHAIADFFAYDEHFRGGITVAAADLTGDGKAELAVGAGEGGGPRVRVYDPLTQQPLPGALGSFFAFDESFRGGVYLGSDALAGDVSGDGVPDLAVGSGPGMAPTVKVYSGATGALLTTLAPFDPGDDGGVRVALAYVDDDEFADVVTGMGPGGSTIRVFSGATGEQLDGAVGEYAPFGASTDGVYVGASNDPPTVTIAALDHAAEPSTVGHFRITRTDTTGDLKVNLTFTGSTATAGTDYTTISSPVTIPSGSATVDVAVTPIDDGATEGTETVFAAIGSGMYFPGSPGSATVNIADDEGASPPPPPTPIVITDFDDDTGASAADNLTKDTKLSVHGSGPASTDVVAYGRRTTEASFTQLGTTTSSAGGLWTVAYNTALSEGQYELIAARALTSGVYDTSASAPYYLIVDTTAPTVVLTLDPSASPYSLAPRLLVAASDPLPGRLSSSVTAYLDVDLNNDNDYSDGGESGYASTTLTNGQGSFTGYTALTVGTAVRLRARVEDAAGNEGSSPPVSYTPAVSPNTWPITTGTPTGTSGTGGATSIGIVWSGNVVASHTLDLDMSESECGCEDNRLVYNSGHAHPLSPVWATVQSDNALGAPSAVLATLTLDGSVASSLSRSGSGLVPGDEWAFALQPSAALSTGGHTYTLAVFVDYPGTGDDVSRSVSGYTFAVDASAGPLGAGWSLTNTDTLYPVSASGSLPAGVLRASGRGGWSFYEQDGDEYVSPEGDAGTLEPLGGGGYRYTSADGRTREFDSSGRMTRWASADGSEVFTYTYDGGQLATMAAPDGGVATFAYSTGRVSTVTAPSGVTTFAYTGSDLTTITDPAGGQHTFAYDASHLMTADTRGAFRREYTYANGMAATVKSGSASTQGVSPAVSAGLGSNWSGPARGSLTDEVGAKSEVGFNGMGQPVVQIAPDGGVTKTDRDSDGYVTGITDPVGRRTTFTVDAAGYTTLRIEPDGGRATFTYAADAYHSLLTATDPLNHTTTYTYAVLGRLETITDPSGGVTTVTWAASGRPESVVNQLGERVTHVYDGHRRLIGTLVGGSPTGTVLYDAAGRYAGTTDPLGNTTTVVNDAVGRPVSSTTPDGATATTVYDAGGFVTGTIAPSGLRTSLVYDGAGRQTVLIEGVGSALERRTTSVYDDAGHLLAVVDPLGNRTSYAYEMAGRRVSVTDPLGNVSRTQYDLSGRVAATADPLGRVTRYGYDAAGRQVSVTDPLGNVSTTVYDAAGQVIATVDPPGNRTTTVYDALGRVVEVVDPLENRYTTVYDDAGQAIATVDPRGNRTTTIYDERGRVGAVVDALGNRVTSGYDAADRRVSVTDPLGNVRTTVYDTSSRVIASVDPLENRATRVYDAAGRLSATVDALGNRTTTVYDALDRHSATIDALGDRTTTVYDAADRVVATTDPLNHTSTTVYDAAGRVVVTIDPLGNRFTSVYDAAGLVASSADALGNVTRYAYDGNGRRVQVTDPQWNVSTNVYDAAGRVSASVDALGRRTTSVYDNGSRLIATIDALGNPSTTTYDSAGNITGTTDPLNRTTTAVYDALNRAVATVDALGDRTTTVYADSGWVSERVDALGKRTTSVHDKTGQLITTIDPLGGRSTFAYDAAGNVVAMTDPLNQTSTILYDALNRPVVSIDPLGNRSTMTYDAAGNVSTAKDPLGRTATFSYDAADRQTTRLDALEQAWVTVYDANGNAVATVDAAGNRTTTVFDAGNRPVATIDPLGHRSTAVYDAVGNVVGTVDPLGNRTTRVYDAINRVVTADDALGGQTSYAYDAAGNRTSLTDPVVNTTTWVYDALNRMITETDPLGANKTFAYDAVGRLASATDRLGRRVDHGYDAAGRKATETWVTAGSPVQTQTWTYDAAGQVLTAQDSDGTYTFTYDAAGRVKTVAEPFALTLTFAYDAAGNRTKVEDSKNGVTTVSFDALNRQSSEELGVSGITPIKETRTYTTNGLLNTVTRQKFALGVWATVGTTTHAYDADSRVTGITHKNSSGTAQATYAYVYDAADRLTSETVNGTQRTYTYDNTSQLTADVGTPYGYDANGNRNMTGYATGAGNRMTNDGTWTYTYDAEGSLTKKSKGASSDTWEYGYDHRNQMVTATYSATDGGAVTKRVTYVYDAIGNRIGRDAWESGGSTTVERFGYDGWDSAKPMPVGNENFDVWADLDGGNALTTRRVFGPGFDELTARESAGGTLGWYLTDRLGSVRGVTDADGTPLTTIGYDAWGQILTNTAPAQGDRYQYTSRESDSSMGLQYNRARMYGPQFGRWLSEDPLQASTISNRVHHVVNTIETFEKIADDIAYYGKDTRRTRNGGHDRYQNGGLRLSAEMNSSRSRFNTTMVNYGQPFDIVDHNLYRYVSNQPTTGIDPAGLMEIKVNLNLRRATLFVKVRFTFEPDNELIWTCGRQYDFTSEFISQVERVWNTHNYLLVGGARKAGAGNVLTDKCEAPALKPQLRLDVVAKGADFRIIPHAGPAPEKWEAFASRGIFSEPYAELYETDLVWSNFTYFKPGSVLQTPIKRSTAAHEFGHLLGLEHPGQDLPWGQRPDEGSTADYEADPPALMGHGSELRPHYFAKWIDLIEGVEAGGLHFGKMRIIGKP